MSGDVSAVGVGESEKFRTTDQLAPYERWFPLLCIGFFSILYFTATAMRAAEKPFWFDELCSLYIVRLPTFAASWQAVLHGADFNPPLFYLIQRADRGLFGEGLIALRLPAMLGFWTLCLCLFRFARKAAGWQAGCIAMVLPIFTGAYYYAYEARPHGIVLGFCGLALVAWQEGEEERTGRGKWLVWFSLSLAAAFFTHCYALVIAIPFGLVELSRSIATRSVKPLRWMALCVPAVIAAISFIPLLRSYRTKMGGPVTGWHDISSFGLNRIPAFYVDLLSPCALLVTCGLGLACLGRYAKSATLEQGAERKLRGWDMALVWGLLAMPVYGNLLARLLKGPFFGRYFMTAVAGACLMVAFGLTRGRWTRGSAGMALLLAVALAADTSLVLAQRLASSPESLAEPSTGWAIDTTIGDPLGSRRWMTGRTGGSLPIVVAFQLDFIYLVHNWPEAKARLYSVSTSVDELQYRLYTAVEEYCHVGYNLPQTYDEFLARHREFFLYGNAKSTGVLAYLRQRSATFEELKFDEHGNFLAKVLMDRSSASPAH